MQRARLFFRAMRPTRAPLALVVLGACGGFASPLSAEPPQNEPSHGQVLTMPPMRVEGAPITIGGSPPPCVSVDIAGHKAGDPVCAPARQLQDAASAAQARAKADLALAAPNAETSSAITVGVGSLTASSQRLGGDLRGATQLPQRPPVAVPTTPFPRQP